MSAELLVKEGKKTVECTGKQGSELRVWGKHVYGNAMGCRKEYLMDEQYLRRVVREAVEIGRMTLLDLKSWRIGLGVSVVAVVLESHVTIHTWPEHDFATIDVYSCGKHTDPERAFEYIVKKLEARRVVKGSIDRSYIV